MKILWIANLPQEVQRVALGNKDHGAQHSISWIVAHLPPPIGVDLHVACLWPGGRKPFSVVYKGATFHLIPCPRHGRLSTLYCFEEYLYYPLYDRLNPDIVHGWGTEESNGLAATRLSSDRHVVGIQGIINVINSRCKPDIRARLTAWMERRTLANAHHVAAESVFAAGAAGKLCHHTKPVVVPQPVREEILGTESCECPGKLAVFLGRISPQKGIGDAILSFAKVAPPEWTLKIVGGGSPREQNDVRTLICETGLYSRAMYVENLSGLQVAALLRQAAILILPTLADSGPTALKEALCMGVWPVCYDNTGPGELVRAFNFGTLAKDLDRNHFVECLQWSISLAPWTDLPRRQDCIARARKAYSRIQAWQCLTALYLEIARLAK